LATVLLAVAGSTGVASPPAVAQSGVAAAPTYLVGDRWVYKVSSRNGRTVTLQETREITSAAPGAIGVKITRNGAGAETQRTESLEAPGLVRSGAVCTDDTRHFPVPLQRTPFPLTPAKLSGATRWVDNELGGRSGRINFSVAVTGWTKVTTPAGTFDVVRLINNVTLDDSTAFREATTCRITAWYAPAVRAVVREQRIADYREKGINAPIRVLNETYELENFSPGKG
jgi:hypothetical protein